MLQEMILIVDDEPTNLGVLLESLEMATFEVLVATQGESALQALRHVRPDLILLDVMMPGIDGFETCRRLKANAATRAIPVIFMTALAETIDEVKGLTLGAVDYITKPFQVETVLARIRTHLALRQAQKQVEAQNLKLQQEIAERQRIETILRKYERIISATPDFISLVDRQYTYQIANAAYLHAMNKSQAEVVGHAVSEFVDPVGFETRTQARLERCLAGDTVQYETWLEFENTGRRFLSLTYAPYIEADQAITGVVISARDITQLKQAQGNLQESEERYRRLVELSPDAIIVQQAGQIAYINTAGVNTLRAPAAADLLGKSLLDFVHPAYQALVAEQIWHSSAEGQPAGFLEVEFVRRDGQVIDVEIASAPVGYHGTAATQSVFKEITERKQAEAQLRAAHQELQVKNGQLRELNASKDKFFSIIAHDLRSPFNALLGFTDLMRAQFDALPPAKLKDYLAKVRLSAERLYALLENLLTWARIQRGLVEYNPQPLDLHELSEEILALFLSNAEQKQIALTSAVPENVLAHADHAMVQTIMRNLVSNALKFTPAGGRITIAAQRTAHSVAVAVADTGTGMSPEVLAQLFRIDTHYTTTGTAGEKGTGLGLILCHDLVQKNGGRLWVESALEQGATFRFTLPESA